MKYLIFILALPALLLFNSCKEETTTTTNPTPPAPEGKTLLGTQEATSLGYTVKLYANQDLFTGYNYLTVKVFETGTENAVKDAEIFFNPLMTMTSGMVHSCPVENPVYSETEDGYFGTATFVMVSTPGVWTLGVVITPNGGSSMEQVDFEVTVTAPEETKIYNFISAAGGAVYFVALVEPTSPEVGINDYEIVVYTRASMMDWPAVTDVNVEIEPIMPSMGHGSPYNVNPVHTTNGHYVGKVNFTMTGYWEINQVFKNTTGEVMDDTGNFPITL